MTPGPALGAPGFSIGVRARHEPALFDLEVPTPTEGQALVRTLYSGLSAGTELTFVKGTDPAFFGHRDPELGVFLPGDPTRRYPFPAMGYMEVAQVVESRRPDLAPGEVVASAYGHRSCHVLDGANVVVPVPADLDPVLGIYLAQMGPIAANGVLHAAAELAPAFDPELGAGVEGRSVLVTGAGVVGLLTGLFAQRGGAASVVICDADPSRLAVARALGLEVVDPAVEAWRWCKDTWVHGPRDRGADLVFQCRADSAVLHQALRSLRPQGTVIDLAFYTGEATELRLGEEFHHNGLTIRCAQINRVPRGMAGAWDRARLAAETLDLLRVHGGAIREHLVTDLVPARTAPTVIMELVRRERRALQIVFDFTGEA